MTTAPPPLVGTDTGTTVAMDTSSTENSAAKKTVQSFTTAIGVSECLVLSGSSGSCVVVAVIPPPEIKAIVDRTADFVRRVGTQFESEIMQRNA